MTFSAPGGLFAYTLLTRVSQPIDHSRAVDPSDSWRRLDGERLASDLAAIASLDGGFDLALTGFDGEPRQ